MKRRPALVRGTHQARLDAWASQVQAQGQATIAELAALWWPEVGDALGWRRGSYPRAVLRRARARVRRLERAGLVVLDLGPLRHRAQVGVVVRPAPKVVRQTRISVGRTS